MRMKISRDLIYTQIAAALGRDVNARGVRRQLWAAIPKAIRGSDGHILSGFAPLVAKELGLESLPQEIVLQQAVMMEGMEQIYLEMVGQRQAVQRGIASARESRQEARGNKLLHDLVLSLGLDIDENRRLAADQIRFLLKVSGVRVYNFNLERGEWHHLLVSGIEEGTSRFEKPGIAPEQSEKGLITRILQDRMPKEELERAIADCRVDFRYNGKWGYLYVADRRNSGYVESDQINRDETGDSTQNREGYGQGNANDILFVMVGGQNESNIDVFMVNNWSAGRPIFIDQEKQMENIKSFAVSLYRARELTTAYQKIKDMAVHDDLTGLLQRKPFMQALQFEFVRAKRYQHNFSIIMLDIDHFKSINDIYGHGFGDIVLEKVAQAIAASVRKEVDVVGRYGGEEFIVLLPETNVANAKIIAERIRKEVEGLLVPFNKDEKAQDIRVTISLGVASYPLNARAKGDVISLADDALYEAKDSGRNKVCVSEKIAAEE